jgi:hypothetical protein
MKLYSQTQHSTYYKTSNELKFVFDYTILILLNVIINSVFTWLIDQETFTAYSYCETFVKYKE